jgi:GH25 family lysozyme M1 (1,4-beta-N-acetylmuramidase)
MAEVETFVKGIHSRPFSRELNAGLMPAGVEWDYGGKLTAWVVAEPQVWTINGPDLSVWQGDIDFDVLGERASFAILRYLYGNTTVDTKLATYYRALVDRKVPVMGYHYLKPGKSWELHADTMAKLLRDYPAVAAWGDLEESGGLGKTLLESWCYKYWMRLEAAIEASVGCYTSPGFLNTAMGLTSWLKWRMAWVANWTLAQFPLLPNEWAVANKPWTMWQWTSKGSGADWGVGSTYVDLNRFNGDGVQFEKVFKVKPANVGVVPPPPPPDPEPEPEPVGVKYRVSVDTLNVRSGPGTKYKDIGDLRAGDEITATDFSAPVEGWVEFRPGEWCCVVYNGRWYVEKI